MSDVKEPIEGYARCETVLPVMGGQIMDIPGMPTRMALVLKTRDGNLALGVTAESAKDIAQALLKAAKEMRRAEKDEMRKKKSAS